MANVPVATLCEVTYDSDWYADDRHLTPYRLSRLWRESETPPPSEAGQLELPNHHFTYYEYLRSLYDGRSSCSIKAPGYPGTSVITHDTGRTQTRATWHAGLNDLRSRRTARPDFSRANTGYQFSTLDTNEAWDEDDEPRTEEKLVWVDALNKWIPENQDSEDRKPTVCERYEQHFKSSASKSKDYKRESPRETQEKTRSKPLTNLERREAAKKRAEELAKERRARKAYSTPLYTSFSERKEKIKSHASKTAPTSPIQRTAPIPREVWKERDASEGPDRDKNQLGLEKSSTEISIRLATADVESDSSGKSDTKVEDPSKDSKRVTFKETEQKRKSPVKTPEKKPKKKTEEEAPKDPPQPQPPPKPKPKPPAPQPPAPPVQKEPPDPPFRPPSVAPDPKLSTLSSGDAAGSRKKKGGGKTDKQAKGKSKNGKKTTKDKKEEEEEAPSDPVPVVVKNEILKVDEQNRTRQVHNQSEGIKDTEPVSYVRAMDMGLLSSQSPTTTPIEPLAPVQCSEEVKVEPPAEEVEPEPEPPPPPVEEKPPTPKEKKKREIVKKEKTDRPCKKPPKEEEQSQPTTPEIDARKIESWIYGDDDFSTKEEVKEKKKEDKEVSGPSLLSDLSPQIIAAQKIAKEKRSKAAASLMFQNQDQSKKLRKPGKLDKSYLDEMRKLELAEQRRKKQMELYERLRRRRSGIFGDQMEDGSYGFDDYGFLAKYCIFNQGAMDMYRMAFDSVDEEKTGFLEGPEVMIALRGVNSKLSDMEEEYLYRVLELTGYKVTNGADFKMFAVLAALSQKISALDSWMKNMIGRMDFKQLEMKMFMCKTLWECNVDHETNKISIDQLCVELRAGGVSFEHELEVREKLSHLTALDLLDYLTYIPLFIMIHNSVVDNPLDDTREK